MKYPIGYPATVFRDLGLADKPGASKMIRIPLENGMNSDVDLHKIEKGDGVFKFTGTSSVLGRINGECGQSSGWIDDDAPSPE